MSLDKVVFSSDLDTTRGLADDGKAYIKVDGTSIGYDATGKLKSMGAVSVTPVVTTGNNTATITVNGTAADLYETATTLVTDSPTCSFTYTNEAGVTTTVNGGLFLSAVAGNAIIVKPDGGLYFAATALLPDDQELTGDSTGTVTLTLTPTVTVDATDPAQSQTNYVIKADVKTAPSVPSGMSNLVKIATPAGTGVYVDPQDVITALGLHIAVNAVTPSIELRDVNDNVLGTPIPLQACTDLAGTVTRGWVSL